MQDVFTLGMRSTQLSESLNSELKIHFKSDFDIIRFLKHFERVVADKRKKELDAEFESRRKQPRIKMKTPMLLQASKLYTPIIFEAFQGEYERSLVACTTTLEGNNEYLVAIGSLDENFTCFEKEYKVTGDPLKQTSTCSCGQFNRFGILCGHALKVLDLMNIKSLPAQYVLKRWTREARCGIVQDNEGRNIIENTKLDDMLPSNPGCTLLVNNTLGVLSKQVEEEINGCTDNVEPVTIPINVAPPSDLVSTARLKKKEVQTKISKRQKTWLDKKRKFTKKGSKKKGQGSMQEQENIKVPSVDGVPVQNISTSTSLPKEGMSEAYMTINTFSQLLTGPFTNDLDAEFESFRE
ncbi:hypothetical protein PAHAL_1G180500 [Panicum hallii]|uniref:Protein FAR1-RELATED SEQUENCE n=1 Tax=Panicum hallii TaxID=206008 RepID=A0A2T8KVL2_9POAL|nr:hypothetical protein PAHAL_1G180500 [Panicum hallii]